MGAIKPFPLKVGGKSLGWRAMVRGKVVDVGDSNATEEQAQAKLDSLLAEPGPTISQIADKVSSATKPAEASPVKPADEPKPGDFRKEGMGELSAPLLKKFRETFAAAIADANYSGDKMLFHFFGYDVQDIPESDKALLKIGWEIACQKYFVDGVPPPWVIILFANVQIVSRMAVSAKAKDAQQPKAIDNAGSNSDGANKPS